MKKIFILAASIFLAVGLSAQTMTDALRLSQTGLNGTSNFISRAGAIGALGGDLTAASYNPAGLGIYNSSEFSFSTGLNWAFTDANSNNFITSDSKINFNLGNIGALFFFKPSGENVKGVQFTFGMNRLKAYGNRTIFQGDGLDNSFISHIISEEMSDAYMYDFYQSYVVDFDTTINRYTSVFENGKFNQIRSYTESGSLNEMVFSLSTNIRNQFYLGATLGIPIANYYRDGSFVEEKVDATGNVTDSYIFNEKAQISATGINLKLGAIFKPVNWVRFGAAIHTPTYYSIEDRLFSEVIFTKRVGGDWDPITYDMQSPFRFIGSLAFVLGDNKTMMAGTISADYEFADYSSMKYRLAGDIKAENNINNIIKQYYLPTNTIRIGGELKLGTIALRAGYLIMDNPYDKDLNDAGAQSITAGVGYRKQNFFMDLAYAYTMGKSKFNEYDYRVIDIENQNHLAQLTFGVRF
ncbi:MAG: hypothetical protein RBT05_03160 [Bacteroidales bacterium]|jgi:hypothetical protein|nr:hypothetical protein [Bacteroidales bacterium]